MLRVFVDGQHGTTGLEIHRLLNAHPHIELMQIAVGERRNDVHREQYLNEADAVVLCLPDDAAVAAVGLIRNNKVRILDASTAHRVDPQWVYGFPEMSAQRQFLVGANRVSNPGCYPTGFVALMRPLIDTGMVPPDLPLSTHAISGYSGGGKKLIERFENRAANAKHSNDLLHGQDYALSMSHKHQPEMRQYSGTITTPLFAPSVGHYYRGMLVHVPLFCQQMKRGANADDIVRTWREAYADEQFVRVFDANDTSLTDEGFLDPQAANHSNRLELMVFGNSERLLLIARLDNLGKGAAGAAVQNLNLMCGIDETLGLPA